MRKKETGNTAQIQAWCKDTTASPAGIGRTRGKHFSQQNQEQGQEGQNQRPKKMRNLNMNDLDDLQGLMTQEEELVTKMMRDQGNTVNYTA